MPRYRTRLDRNPTRNGHGHDRPLGIPPRCDQADRKNRSKVRKRRRWRKFRLQSGRIRRLYRLRPWLWWVTASILLALTLGSRLAIAYYLANDAPGDGVIYARMARNL